MIGRRVFLGGTVTLAWSLAAFGCGGGSPADVPKSETIESSRPLNDEPTPSFDVEKSRQRAVELQESHEKNREEILRLSVQLARADPSYAKAILATRKEDLLALTGFSLEEKLFMWRRTQEIQQALKAAGFAD